MKMFEIKASKSIIHIKMIN